MSLSKANLSNTDLSRAQFTWADRLEWTISNAPTNPEETIGISTASMKLHLFEIDLSEAYLIRARLGGVVLAKANMSDARLPEADLSEADLSKADLSYASLQGARLRDTNLSGADLTGADLTDADLSGACLKGYPTVGIFGHGFRRDYDEQAAIVRDDQLMRCKCLTGATMPDGKILKSDNNPNGPTFEEWLKSKNRTEDG